MSEDIGMTYARWHKIAERSGWVLPRGLVLTQPGWYDAWIRYWVAMDDYSRGRSEGRPVPPHRSA
jgi:hypothetical protein